MADCLTTSPETRARVRELHAEGIPKAQIARQTRVPRSTVRDLVDDRPPRERPIPSEKFLLDVAVEYFVRFGVLPYSTALNPTRAGDKLGGTAWRRCLEGRVDRTGEWRPWPQEHDYTRRFGSWENARVAILAELDRRRIEHDPYVARPIADDRRRYAALCGHSLDVLRQGVVARPALEPRFPPSMQLDTARKRGALGAIGEPGRGLSSILAYVAQRDLLDPTVVTVVIQRPDKPSIAEGLWPTNMVDLPCLIADGIPAYVESGDQDVRMVAISAAAQASIDSARDVSLIVDDAEDVVECLATLLYTRDAPRTHISAAWTPRDDHWHLGLFLQLRMRFVAHIDDDAVGWTFSKALATSPSHWDELRAPCDRVWGRRPPPAARTPAA